MWNLWGVMALHRYMVNWRRGWSQSVIGICTLCYIWNLYHVMVFQGSMLAWRRGWGSICHGYMCILLYMKLFGVMVFHGSMVNWRSGWVQLTIDPCYTITPHKSAQAICALCYMWNWCGVVVFHGSTVNWRGSAASRSAKFGPVVFKASLLKWGGQCHRSMLHHYTPWVCTSICALCYMWNLCGVVVFYGLAPPPPPINNRSILHHYTL